MAGTAAHRRVVGARRADRLAWTATTLGDTALVVRCHQRLRGPYTGVDALLREILPAARARWPELVEAHRVELLYGMPELEELIGPAPRTLASEAPFKERTRWFGAQMVRCMSQGIVTFLLEHARRSRAAGEAVPVLVLDEVHAAELTTQELVALLVRRADPALLPVVAAGTSAGLLPELDAVLARHAELIEAPATLPVQETRDEAALVAAYVASDGTSDDPAEVDAYHRADPAAVSRLHDERAMELEPGAGWGLRVGAIAYHRERGSDPAGAGRLALREALRHCVAVGFSAMAVDLGMRGRAVTDPIVEQEDFCEFTNRAASALVPIGRLEESLALYLDLRQRYTVPKVHMTSSYAIAMLHTRFLRPRDHDAALQWQNNARAIAELLPDPDERLVFSVFQDNALALIHMHRGNLQQGLDLINAGMARLDEQLRPDQWVLHRSQLLYNRARLLAAMRRFDEAVADYTTLIEMDPYYTDYLSERAKVARLRGDFAAALADYDRAVELAAPFPELFHNRGTARVEVGDVDGALADFGYVLEMEPDDAETRLARGEVLLGIGEIDAAEADAQVALAARPGAPRLLCLQGKVELARGAWTAALAAFDQALAADPREPAALGNRAVAHYELGHFQQAVDDLTAALAVVGDDPDILLNRGLSHYANGRPDLALADFDRAIELPGADANELRRQRQLCIAGRERVPS
ncbi:MAG: tetratricopeptide repeat protein [Frankiaceae bacterium]